MRDQKRKCLNRAWPPPHEGFSSLRRDSMVFQGLQEQTILHLEYKFLHLRSLGIWQHSNSGGQTLAFKFKFWSIKIKTISLLAMHCTKTRLSHFLSHLYLTLAFYTSLCKVERRQINHFIFYLCSQYVNTGLQLSGLTTPKKSTYINQKHVLNYI